MNGFSFLSMKVFLCAYYWLATACCCLITTTILKLFQCCVEHLKLGLNLMFRIKCLNRNLNLNLQKEMFEFQNSIKRRAEKVVIANIIVSFLWRILFCIHGMFKSFLFPQRSTHTSYALSLNILVHENVFPFISMLLLSGEICVFTIEGKP